MANCKNRNNSFNGALGTLGGLYFRRPFLKSLLERAEKFALPARQSGLFHKTTH